MEESKPEFKVPSISLSKKKKSLEVVEVDSNERPPAIDSSTTTPDQPTDGAGPTTADSNSTPVVDEPVSTESVKTTQHKTDSSSQSFPPAPYTVPHWSGPPSESYFLSVIKNGTLLEEISIGHKPYIVFGRLPCCDVPLEHPSLSRYHAVLQYRPQADESEQSSTSVLSGNPREAGYYVYDLGSTHGTVINKTEISPRCYCRLRVGQMVKFGGSSRMFLLESGGGGQGDVEASAQEEIREIIECKEEMERKKAEAQAAREKRAKQEEEMGCTWGMLMDDLQERADEEEHEIDPEREAYYVDDPKKALNKFFDREGLELEYETEEEGPPRARIFTAKIRLPIDTAGGEGLYAEASVQGKKKDAVLQCALNACRLLDAHDMLRENSKKRQKRKRNWAENDYYDSDEDTFLDRTGNIEDKRKQRMKKAGVAEDSVQTYQSLQEELAVIKKEKSQIERKLKRNQQVNKVEGDLDLDDFMSTVRHQLDPSHKRELKQRLHTLKKDEERVSKLVSIAKPTEMPAKLTDNTQSIKAPPYKVPKLRLPKASQPKPTVPESQKEEPTPDSKGKEDPPPAKESKDLEEKEVKKPPTPKRRKSTQKIGPQMPPPSTPGNTEGETKCETEEDYSDWMPPQHQSGDGRTHLNDKFGY